MSAYIVQRLLSLVPVLLFVSLITFGLMHTVEGGPWDAQKKLDPRVVANLNAKYGLDKPVWRQYVDFLTGALQGDLGVSYSRQDKPVTQIILDGVPTSATLGLLAVGLAVAGGISLGVVAAAHRNGLIDNLSVLLASVGSAVPSFALGIILVYFFAVKLGWLPTRGWGSWQEAVLPVVTLAALPTAYLARVTRASMVEVLAQDYVRTARAKGLEELSVLLQHGLKNALLPVVTLIGPMVAALVTGSFIVESLFGVPGIGSLFVESVSKRDYGLIMGTTLFYAFVLAIANLAVDLTYAALDPRIRLAGR
jgi:oligopeptide transport system permease protein